MKTIVVYNNIQKNKNKMLDGKVQIPKSAGRILCTST